LSYRKKKVDKYQKRNDMCSMCGLIKSISGNHLVFSVRVRLRWFMIIRWPALSPTV